MIFFARDIHRLVKIIILAQMYARPLFETINTIKQHISAFKKNHYNNTHLKNLKSFIF